MKRQMEKKKLVLAKETVRRITERELGNIAGGTFTGAWTNSIYADCPWQESHASCTVC